MIKHIMSIEDDMTAIPHLAHRDVGLKALWGQREMVRDYFKHGVVDTGLREVNWRVTMRAVTNKNARFLSRLSQITNGHVDGQEGLDDPFTDTSAQPQVRDIVPQQLTPNISKLSPRSSFHSAKTNCHSLPAPTILCPDLAL
jgi:hypothetical protein